MNFFSISNIAIEPELLRLRLGDGECGGYVCFEGWVRNHNEGHQVRRLEYEVYETLAMAEGTRILHEAVARFGVSHTVCVHRAGALGIGDLAVWVGVSLRLTIVAVTSLSAIVTVSLGCVPMR